MAEGQLYKKFAVYYDKIYKNVDYAGESEFINWAVNKHKTSSGFEIMDMACGTGSHAKILKNSFKVTGVDINEDMIKIAQDKVPEADFIIGNMKDLNIGKKFDVIICIFSAIHYNRDLKELDITLTNFYNHMKDGGILIYDLSFNTENWIEGLVSLDTVVEDKLKIARMCQSQLKNGIFNANFVFLVKDDGKFDFDIDEHELGVFKINDVSDLMEKIGFKTFIYADFKEKKWESGEGQRPIFVGVKNSKQVEK
ncbi:class I SAM-dependent DNA methyltransferase [Methanobacterium spitsbergense]|uniref:Class I SAM-dependent methyltransferase n=1 Tax=Methanobacterium spitsbergense TaxID=2874285 RepID=A0A8T5UXU9_9EURY|nr:class I SAM-dependent methyltransferase [Methanobacterium spitsbergense]MBZ2165529.1 class I SAM-dependent methyltransferase [Methanobacterium spitsbergense]